MKLIETEIQTESARLVMVTISWYAVTLVYILRILSSTVYQNNNIIIFFYNVESFLNDFIRRDNFMH
jgi:hypothetical protein